MIKDGLNMKKDKQRIILLSAVIAFLIFLILGLITITILNIKKENTTTTSKLSTTTRRTADTTISTTSKILPEENMENTTSQNRITTQNTTSSQGNKTTKKNTTSRKTTSTRITTKKEQATTSSSSSSFIPEKNKYETTNESTNYENAVDSWEWEIVKRINDERKKNGLSELRVAVRLRQLAEEAADIWNTYTDADIDEYLEGYSHYGIKSNTLNETTGYLSLYNRTINKTDITKDKTIEYIGVGVIYLKKGISGIPSYYYVIIYE